MGTDLNQSVDPGTMDGADRFFLVGTAITLLLIGVGIALSLL